MNNIATYQQRDAESSFLDGKALQLIHCIHISDVEYRSNTAVSQSVSKIVRGITVTRIELTHLADFFGHCHLGKQRVYALFDRLRFVFWFY